MRLLREFLLAALAIFALAGPGYIGAQDKSPTAPAPAQIAKAVGTIKSVQADTIIVSPESGGDVTAKLLSSTKILRVPPGEKTLQNATTLQPQDLQPGDRVLVRGQALADGHSIAALSVIVMKQSDLAAKQEHDREDWQKRGVGGLVTKVDAADGIITVSSGGIGPNHSIQIRVLKTTTLRRYAPDSVKFDDAKPAPIDQIKIGDQLRARGTRNTDDTEVTADEVVTGSFRNIAGIIKAIDPANQTMTVQDAISKNTVVVKVSPDSEMKKLPAEMAQHIAMRLKSMGNGGSQAQHTAGGEAHPAMESEAGHGPATGQHSAGAPDLQRLLNRLPSTTLADLHKGDAVMIVSTDGANSGAVTAITLLAGVDPILTAAPNRSASSLLSPWSLGAPAEGEGAQ
ncbi:MAG: hypothetical protein WBW53_06365 [Terriglobales bacterium]